MSEKLVIPPADKLGPSEAAEFRRWLRDLADDSILRLQLERHGVREKKPQ